MLTELCAELRNYFANDIRSGTYTISGGVIELLPFLMDGQYYRIVGSIFNDGVHKYGDAEDTLTDEVFDGEIWAMAVPKDFIALANDISDWCEKYGDASVNPYTSESFGGYSYSKTTGAGGTDASWRSVFRSRLNPWRKI